MNDMRLIDADSLDDVVMRLNAEENRGITRSEYKLIDSVLFEFPTIEAQPERTGKWERHYSRPNVYADLYWHCSECGYKNDDQYANVHHKFCPNCGARMEEGE